MKKKSFLFLVSCVLMAICVGCGGNSKSSETATSQDTTEIGVDEDLPEVVHKVERGSVVYASVKDTLRLDSIVYDIVKDWGEYKQTSHYCIPQAWSTDTAVSNNINNAILDELEIDNPTLLTSDWLRDVSFKVDTDSTILHLNLKWEWFASKGEVNHQSDLFFNMEDGTKIECRKFPFSALFTTKGYIEFLQSINWFNKFHDAVVKGYNDFNKQYPDEYSNDVLLSEIERVYDSRLWDIDYEVKDGTISFWREKEIGSVFGGGGQSEFEPHLYEECKLSALDPYLNDVGKEVLRLDSMKFIQQKLREKQLWEEVDNYAYAEVDGVRFGINMSDSLNMTGHVFFKRRCEQIKGFVAEDNFQMTSKSGEHFRFPTEKAITKMSEWNESKYKLHQEWR